MENKHYLEELKSNANLLNLNIDIKGELRECKESRTLTKNDLYPVTDIEGEISSLTISKKDDPDKIFLQVEDIDYVLFRFSLEEKKLTVMNFEGGFGVCILNENGRLRSDEDYFRLRIEDLGDIFGVDFYLD